MKVFSIPNFRTLTIENILFDLNGTIQFSGEISLELIEKFQDLNKFYNVFIISADTRGNLKDLAEKLNVNYIKIMISNDLNEAEAKNRELEKLGKNKTAAIGNGNNDALMLKSAALGIAILGKEGLSVQSLLNCDVVMPDPISAINFLLDEKTLIATLRS
ncbi:MAG: HAD family hydrolase [Promethearchaeota archaeon]